MPYLQPVTEGGAHAPAETSSNQGLGAFSRWGKAQRRHRCAPALGALGLLAFSGLPAHANPNGEQVVAGQALFERSLDQMNLTVTQGSDRAVINWRDFSIGAEETTQFIQPGATSATLNRVMNGLTSQIDGNLLANGQIYLINPNGIIVGPTGRIDVGSFIGSSLDVSDDAFMAGGDMTFAGQSQASVINFGTINAIGGDVFLIGRTVENHGLLNAPNGTVGLGAGEEVLIRAAGEERLFVQPKGSGGSGTGVTNTGTIQAATAELKANGNMYALAINNGGIIRATGVQKKGGHVYLSAPGGAIESTGEIYAKDGAGGGGLVKVDASGGGSVKISGKVDAAGDDKTGGQIQITGDTVDIAAGAELNASGITGGGTVLVGGGAQGQDPAIQNAVKTFVDYGAIIRADSYQSGNAGAIVVWSDGSTEVHGEISARAYGLTGNGGQVELSGKQFLTVTSLVDGRSAHGKAGSLLLDPGTVNIIHSVEIEGGANEISDAYINQQLATMEVTINAVTDEDLFGNIMVQGAVNIGWSSANNLILKADRSITTQEGSQIHATGTGSIILEANMGATQAEGFFTAVHLGGSIIADKGNISISGRSGADGGTGVFISPEAGPVAPQGDIYIFGSGFNDGYDISFNNLSFDKTAGSVTLDGYLDGGILSTSGSGWNLSLTSGGSIYDALILGHSGVVELSGGVFDFYTGFTHTAGQTKLNAAVNTYGSDITLGEVILTGADTELYSEGGNITLGKTDAQTNHLLLDSEFPVSLEGNGPNLEAGSITLADAGNTLGALAVNGADVTIVNNGDITQYDAWQANTLSLDSQGHKIILKDDHNYFGDITLVGDATTHATEVSIHELDSITQGNAWFADWVNLNAGNGEGNIVLDIPGGNNIGAFTLKGYDVSIANNLDIVNHFDALLGPDPWSIGHDLTLYSRGHSITLTESTNTFGGSIAIVNNEGFPTIPTLSIYASSDIVQNGSWAVAGNTILRAFGHDITVNNEGNSFGDLSLGGGNVKISDSTELTDMDGEAFAWHTGNIEIDTPGDTNITLDNDFNTLGAISLTGNPGTLVIHEKDNIDQGNVWHVGDAYLVSTGSFEDPNTPGEVNLGMYNYEYPDSYEFSTYNSLSIRGGSAYVVAGGDIRDNAVAWNVTGDVTLLAHDQNQTYDISLLNDANVLGDIDLDASNVEIHETGDITQGGVWHVGNVKLVANQTSDPDNLGGGIYLDYVYHGEGSDYNTFGDLTLIGTSARVIEDDDITDGNFNDETLETNAWHITGPVYLDANPNSQNELTHSVYLDNDDNVMGDITIASPVSQLTISENDDITQDGPWMVGSYVFDEFLNADVFVGGYTTLSSHGHNIYLADPENVFGYIDIQTQAAELTLTENDDIDQEADWHTTGNTIISALNGHNINLYNDFNVFGDLALVGNEVYLSEEDDITDIGSSLNPSPTVHWQTGYTSLYVNSGESSEAFDIVLDNEKNVMGDIAIWSEVNKLTIYENDDITQDFVWRAGLTTLVSTGDVFVNNIDIGEGTSYNEFGDLQVIADNLYLVEDDDITDGAAWNVTGHVQLRPIGYATHDIVLDNPDNVLGDIELGSEGTPDELNAVTIFENDDIIQSGSWHTGATVLNSGTGNIVLQGGDNILGDLTLTGNSVFVVENDDITQDGAWTTGHANLNAGTHDIVLDVDANVMGDLTVTGNNVAIHENDDITQFPSDFPFIGQWQTGATTLKANGHDIILNNAGNVMGDITILGQAHNITITENDDITQGSTWKQAAPYTTTLISTGSILLNYGGDGNYNTFGDLTLTAASLNLVENDDIYDGGAWHIDGQVTLNASPDDPITTHSIYLDNVDNVLGDILLAGFGYAQITENDAITQSGAWVYGNTLLLNSGGHNITLNQSGNLLSTIAINGHTPFLTIYEDDAILQSGSWDAGPVTLFSNNNNITLDGDGNTLGALTIIGTIPTLIIHQANDITQGNTWNANATTLISASDIHADYADEGEAYNHLGTLTIRANNLFLREDEDIIQGGAWSVDREVHLRPVGFTTHDIKLENPLNALGDIFLPDALNTVSIAEAGDLTQGNVWHTGALTINAGGGIFLDFTDGEGGYNVFGDLSLTGLTASIAENDDITDGAAWNVPGVVALNSYPDSVDPVGSIYLDNSGNVLGAISIPHAVQNLTIRENNNMTQGGAWNSAGTTIFDAGTKNITLTNAGNRFGDLTVTGNLVSITENEQILGTGLWTTGATTLKSNGNGISLTNASNVLGAISITGSAGDVEITEADDVTQGSGWTASTAKINAAGHDIILTNAGNNITAAQFTANTVQFTNNANINQSGAWTVTGLATLNAQGHDITLADLCNQIGSFQLTGFVPNLTLANNLDLVQSGSFNAGITKLTTTGESITLDSDGNVFGDLTIRTHGGALYLKENDAITQGGAWHTGNTAITTQGGQDVTLDNLNNTFGLIFVQASDTAHVSVTANGDIRSLSSWTTGALTLNSRGNDISLNADFNILGDVTLIGDVASLELTDSTNLTQGNSWSVLGNTTLRSGGSIILNNADNTFGDLAVTAINVALAENSDITQFESWTVFGNANLNAGTHDITLANPENQFGSITLNAKNASIRESGDMVIAGATIEELLQVRAGLGITQTDSIHVNTLTAQADNAGITLNHPLNKILFLGDVGAQGGVDIFEDPGLTIGGTVFSATGNVSIGSFGGNLIIGPGGTVNAAASGAQIVLYTDHLFLNNSTSLTPALTTGAGGFWLIYAGASAGSNFGNLHPDFTQFSTTYPNLPSGVGNGILIAANAPFVPLPVDFPGLPDEPGIFIPSPLPGQNAPLVSSNPINDYSNIGSGLYVQNEGPEGTQKEYEERYEGEANGNAGTPGNTSVKDTGPGDGVTEFGSDGTKGIPQLDAPKELLDNLANENELQDAL